MTEVTTPVDEVTQFHRLLSQSWDRAGDTLVDPEMILFVPEEFPWQSMTFRGGAALRGFREALDVLSAQTFESVVEDAAGNDSVVVIRCRESAIRNYERLEWTALWIYFHTAGRIREAKVLHALSSDELTSFWCA